MKKIVKTITFYDDGTYVEQNYYTSPMPSVPPQPYKREAPFPDPLVPYWDSKQCPKCGIKLDGPMGYVCPNNPCPAGLGGVWCGTGDCV